MEAELNQLNDLMTHNQNTSDRIYGPREEAKYKVRKNTEDLRTSQGKQVMGCDTSHRDKE